MRALAFFAVASVLAAGCGRSSKEDGGGERAEVEARVRAIEQCARRVQSGDTSAAPLKFPDGEKVKFTDRTRDVNAPPEGNTLLLHIGDVLDGKADIEFARGDWGEFSSGQSAARVDRSVEWGAVRWPSVRRLLEPRYLLLVKTDKVTLPDVNFEKKMFTTGSVVFSVYGFDLRESKDLGVVRGRSENSDKISVNEKKANTTDPAKVHEEMKNDLERSTALELKKVLKGYSE